VRGEAGERGDASLGGCADLWDQGGDADRGQQAAAWDLGGDFDARGDLEILVDQRIKVGLDPANVLGGGVHEALRAGLCGLSARALSWLVSAVR
jgi:hypothetical protein